VQLVTKGLLQRKRRNKKDGELANCDSPVLIVKALCTTSRCLFGQLECVRDAVVTCEATVTNVSDSFVQT